MATYNDGQRRCVHNNPTHDTDNPHKHGPRGVRVKAEECDESNNTQQDDLTDEETDYDNLIQLIANIVYMVLALDCARSLAFSRK